MVRVPNLSDEDVMAQLRQGHPDALPILFDRFYRLVLNVGLRILHDPGEAEDVMQEVFFEIFNKAAQFDPARGSTKTWILRTRKRPGFLRTSPTRSKKNTVKECESVTPAQLQRSGAIDRRELAR